MIENIGLFSKLGAKTSAVKIKETKLTRTYAIGINGQSVGTLKAKKKK